MAPAEARQIVSQARGQIAHGAVGLDRGRAVALRQLGAVGSVDQRHVGEHRQLPAHGLVDLHLAGGIGEVIDAADHVRDAHVVVVDDDGVVVDRRAVAAQDDHVVEVGVLPHDAALYPVLDDGLAVERRLEADDRLHAGGRILGIAVAPAAVVRSCERFPAARARLAHARFSSLGAAR